MSEDEVQRLERVLAEALKPYVFKLGRWLAIGAFSFGVWLAHLTFELNAARKDREESRAWRFEKEKTDAKQNERLAALEAARSSKTESRNQ